MGAMICPRCGMPLAAVADGVVYVPCGHQPASAAQPLRADLLDAYERWSYGEGWTDGLATGDRRGFDEGFRAGFEAGAEVGAVRILLALEHVLQGQLPDLLPELPHAAEYESYRTRTAPTDSPCNATCGRCSRCIRAAAVARNLRTLGHPDFRGLHADPSPARRGHVAVGAGSRALGRGAAR